MKKSLLKAAVKNAVKEAMKRQKVNSITLDIEKDNESIFTCIIVYGDIIIQAVKITISKKHGIYEVIAINGEIMVHDITHLNEELAKI